MKGTIYSFVDKMGRLGTAERYNSEGGGGGGMEPFVVTFTYNSQTGFSCNKTLAEITAAKNAGKYVEGVFNSQYCPLVQLTNEMALFQRMVTSGTVVDLEWISVGANGCMADIIPLEMAETTETVADIAATILPEDKHIYQCGELTSLTISNPPATGKYTIIFSSGATATVVTGIDNFTVEANKRYRIDVEDGYATFDSWPYTTA